MTELVPVNVLKPIRPVEERSGNAGRTGAAAPGGLEFSKHLLDRISRRQLDIDATQTRRLHEAFDKAEAKGSQESLVLMDDLAFIISVKNRTVVTAMNKHNLKEGVFTNIDSAIIM